MLTFCTLFDENYLDKGLVLYKSLERVCKDDFRFYILCMSDKCFEILTDLEIARIRPIRLSDFENEELLKVKPNRTVGEYCWTCDSSLIKYVLETFNPEYCTYLDSDMAFYDDPQVIIDEMKRRNASVSIVGHRFNKETAEKQNWIYGKYCVECNTFKNDEKGKELLNIWVNQCLEYCSADGDGIHFGDQKYMDNWINDYPYAIELENLGAGVAKWNLSQYQLVSSEGDNIQLKCRGELYRLLFYHFQGITFLEEDLARINVFPEQGRRNKKLALIIYDSYLADLAREREMLKNKYGIVAIYKKHPGYNTKMSLFVKLISVAKNIWHYKLDYFTRMYDYRRI